MKKLLSMLLVVAMIASMSLVAFAAETNTMSVEVVETDDGIVATFYITNPSAVANFTAALAFDSTKVSADKTTPYTLGADFAGTTVSPGSKAGNVKFAQTFGTSTDRYVTKSGKVVAISFPFTRVDADADLTNVFSYGTLLYVSKLVGDGTELTSAKNADNFVAPVYIDNRTPVGGGETPEEPEGSWGSFVETDKTSWAAATDVFKYYDASKNEVTGNYTGKKVVAFGKNASNKAYAAGEYGIKIGINEYPGAAPVAAGKVFAIVLIDTNNNTKVGSSSYTYSIWTKVDGVTVEKTNGLSAVIAQ